MVFSCKKCSLEFSSQDGYHTHYINTHKNFSPSIKKILILGGGFGTISVLKNIQKILDNEKTEITIVSDKNYFLFSPMLPQVSSGLLHPSNISIPMRNFCTKSKFIQASVEAIDLNSKLVTIQRTFDGKVHALEYDYLVLALGSKINFFSNNNLENHSFPIKTTEDALSIRNHVLKMLEHADQTGSLNLQRLFLSIIVIGSGFAGVETIGELNHFIRRSIKKFYPNIHDDSLNLILVSSRDRILPEINPKIGRWAEEYLCRQGIRIFTNSRALDATENSVTLTDRGEIQCSTIIWAGGVKMDPLIINLDCDHDKRGRIITNQTLQIPTHQDVFVLGDCASIKDEKTNEFYPATAQHAIREGSVVAKNLKKLLEQKSDLQKFAFDSMGTMAIIGNKTAVAEILHRSITGYWAWVIWRLYYLSKIPSNEKKLKIVFQWITDSLFSRDLTLIGMIKKKNFQKIHIVDSNLTAKERLFSDVSI